MEFRRKNTALIAAVGIVAVMLVMVIGTIQKGRSAKNATDEAVRTVSSLYLDELAGRREKVVSDNLKDKISDIQTALELIEESDLYSMESLEAYQSKMKRLFTLEKFAFVDSYGLIYTSKGTQSDIAG